MNSFGWSLLGALEIGKNELNWKWLIPAGIYIEDEISHPMIAIYAEESHHSLQFCQKSFYIRTNYGVLCYTFES